LIYRFFYSSAASSSAAASDGSSVASALNEKVHPFSLLMKNTIVRRNIGVTHKVLMTLLLMPLT